jgi:integrase
MQSDKVQYKQVPKVEQRFNGFTGGIKMITQKELEALQQGKWLSDKDGRGRGAGALAFYRSNAGTLLAYFRCQHNGKRQDIPLGNIDKSGVSGITIAQVRSKVTQLSEIYRTITSDIRGYLNQQQQDEQDKREKQQRIREESHKMALLGNLGCLMTLYTDYLQWQGKSSAKQVARDLGTHLYKHPIANIMAGKVTASDLRDWLSPLVQANKTNIADKLRGYINTAYKLAITAESNPALPEGFAIFAVIDKNPAEKTIKLHTHSTKDERTVLTMTELNAYYIQLIAQPNTAHNDVLLLSLLLAGQRTEQLSRCEISDINANEWLITQWDSKGMRTDTRPHVLPLQGESLSIATRRMQTAKEQGISLIFSNGKVVVSKHTLGKHCSKMSTKMLGAGMISEPFNLHDIRRSCETHLSKLGISSDIRAQLLSHGISGVQAKHYDRNDYMDEKRRALTRWQGMLKALPTQKVIPIRMKAA